MNLNKSIESHLTSKESQFLEHLNEKKFKEFIRDGVISLVIYTIISLIPMNFLRSKRGDIIGDGSSQNLIAYLGLSTWLLLLLLISLAYFYLKGSDDKIFSMKKDLKEKVKVHRKSTIRSSGNQKGQLWFKVDGPKPNIFKYDQRLGKKIYDNQPIDFEYYKYSGIVIKINE